MGGFIYLLLWFNYCFKKTCFIPCHYSHYAYSLGDASPDLNCWQLRLLDGEPNVKDSDGWLNEFGRILNRLTTQNLEALCAQVVYIDQHSCFIKCAHYPLPVTLQVLGLPVKREEDLDRMAKLVYEKAVTESDSSLICAYLSQWLGKVMYQP